MERNQCLGGRGLQSLWGRSPPIFGLVVWRDTLPTTTGVNSIGTLFRTRCRTIPRRILRSHRSLEMPLSHIWSWATHLIHSFLPIFYFYKRLGSQWVLRDSSYDFARLFISPSGILYRYGPGGIQRQSGTTWNTVLSQLAAVGMGASTENNIFAVGYESNGRVYHYNGSDWFEFTQLRMQNVRFQSVWTDGKEAFVIGITSDFSNENRCVLHGR